MNNTYIDLAVSLCFVFAYEHMHMTGNNTRSYLEFCSNSETNAFEFKRNNTYFSMIILINCIYRKTNYTKQ